VRHGPTPRGVDWTCRPTQELRFVQLLRICDLEHPVSLDDFGCGYGALLAYLNRAHPDAVVDYLGIDPSRAMVRAARRVHVIDGRRRFLVGDTSPRVADYAVCSGVMNVRLDHTEQEWEGFVTGILRRMRSSTRFGFAVNFMAKSPTGPDHPQLYRTDPAPWISLCSDALGCSVEVLTGYGLREFTLLARHD